MRINVLLTCSQMGGINKTTKYEFIVYTYEHLVVVYDRSYTIWITLTFELPTRIEPVQLFHRWLEMFRRSVSVALSDPGVLQ